jgi:hypothetical protein
MTDRVGRVPDGTGLSQAEPSSTVSALTGFDPSRDKTALSYWFPKVEAAGLPVPKTLIVPMPNGVRKTIFTHLWGEEADPSNVEAFVAELRGIAAPLGYPFFLRTDHTSGKHNWRETCFVADPAQLGRHVYAIAEDSEMAGIVGMPWNVWVVREMLRQRSKREAMRRTAAQPKARARTRRGTPKSHDPRSTPPQPQPTPLVFQGQGRSETEPQTSCSQEQEMTDLIGLAERRIGAAGEKLAAQLGGVFTINPRKLSDYRARACCSD